MVFVMLWMACRCNTFDGMLARLWSDVEGKRGLTLGTLCFLSKCFIVQPLVKFIA